MLFRNAVINAKKQKITGNIILVQPTSIYLVTLLTFLTLSISIFFLIQSEYSRKEKVAGYLIPEKGLVKIFSDREGTLEELYVKEGQSVSEGQPLVRVKNSQNLATGVELSKVLSKEITKQISTLEIELEVSKKIFLHDTARLKLQINQISRSLEAIKKAKVTNRKRLEIKKKQYLNNLKLLESKYISADQLGSIQEEYLEAMESNDRFEREISSITLELSSLESDKDSLPEKRILKQALLERHISELKSKQFELENQYEFVKLAPESGITTAIQPSLGMHITNRSPILSIIPHDSPLEIELFLPTRSAGFVKIGDPVQIRFDAFPHQKFGLTKGIVVSVDKALVLPSDKVFPINIGEAMYRVRAKLTKQNIHAYGKSFPLKVGMIAEADILLEKRTLLEWILDPIYALKGQLR